VPGLRRAAVENRRFLRRVVRFLAAEAGIIQFLDIGVGLPTQGAMHEVAREVNPDVRDQIFSFFDGFELLEPGLVPKHQWRPVTGQAAAGPRNIQWAR